MIGDFTQEYLKSLLWYCPNTGNFIWVCRRKGLNQYALAGTKDNGYIRIGIDGKQYMAHVLAYLYMTSEWPENDIDHEDLLRDNNAWYNLRHAATSQNCGNTFKRSTNTSGVKGVTWDKFNKKWRAKIQVNYKYFCLGRYDKLEDAAKAYEKAALEYFGEFARIDECLASQ